MDTFRMIATVLSMILGLGVTRLLLGIVAVFRARKQSTVDWLPIAWAGCLFVEQLQFWWAINYLPTIKPTFSFLDFVCLVFLTLMLFVTSALILPSRAEDEKDGLRSYFEKDGRYGLLALAGFTLVAFFIDVYFFRASPLATWGILDLPMFLLPCIGFAARARRLQVATVCVYVPLCLIDIWVVLQG